MFNSKFFVIAAAMLSFAIEPLSANGYSHSTSQGFGAVSAKALGQTYSRYQGSYGHVSQKSTAGTKSSIQHGSILDGHAWATTSNTVHVGKNCKRRCGKGSKVKIKDRTEARTKIYAKGNKVLLKARSKNYLSVHVDGKLWFENEQTAIAVGRHTPLGSQAASWARNNGTLSARGMVRYSSGNVASSSVSLK